MTEEVASHIPETLGRVVGVADIDERMEQQMLELMSRYFDGIDEAAFRTDLRDKGEVILILAGERIVGFSTMQVKGEVIAGRPTTILFSGDTIVDVEYWSSPVLQREFVRCAVDLMRKEDNPVYWFLLCSGYRTYRYLPVFFKEFWPQHGAETPPQIAAMMKELAAKRYGDKYRHGVVADLNGRLRDGVSPINDKLLANAHIAHFLKMNPGHAEGDELVCLARIAPDNLTRAVSRVVGDL